MHTDTCVVVPVFNEEQVLIEVINELSVYFRHIICVDDGSTDGSVKAIQATTAKLVQHPHNRGQGAALQTGIDAALAMNNVKYVVTFDADGQHAADDADRMVRYMKDNREADVALGSRFLGEAKDISLVKLAFLKLAIVFSNATTGLKLTDTHNGLRVFGRRFAENLQLKANGMAHASEIIFKIARHNYAYAELPVTIRYTDYSKAKGQSMLGAFVIVRDLWAQRTIDR